MLPFPQVAILCGGLGTRLRPALPGLPKPLAPVGGRPWLRILVAHLRDAGASHIVLCTGKGGDAIAEHFAAHPVAVDLVFSRESHPMGTGGALALATPFLHSDPVMVLKGDSLVPGHDWRALLQQFQAASPAGMMVVVPRDDRQDTGCVQLDSRLMVRAFAEKQPLTAAPYQNAGVYLLTRQLLAMIPQNRPSSLEKDWLPLWLSRSLRAYVHLGTLLDIGTPQRWADAQRHAADLL
ncbi:MAG: sugar phosphate nucleotidyltransferase [Terriglobales bacterium]